MSLGRKHPPLVVFALDAGDIDFIQRWVDDGSLPNLGRIMRQGCWSHVSDPKPFSQFGQWTTLLSGIPRHCHGYYYFRQLVPSTYELRPFSHLNTGLLPFWSHLRGRGVKVAAIDAPEGALVPGLDGIQLSQWSARHLPQRPLPLSADPPEVLLEAQRVFGKRDWFAEFAPRSTPTDDLAILHRMLNRIERKGRLCRHLLTKDRYDLMVIGYYEIHDASHRFWNYRLGRDFPQCSALPELCDAIHLVYQAIDRELGLLLASLSGEPTVAVLSCYGMAHMFPMDGLIEAFCHELGYQVSESRRGGCDPLNWLRRLFPKPLRRTIGERLPVRIQETLLSEQYRTGTNWERTRAFSIPSIYTGFIRVNLRNREPQGCVTSGRDYDTLVDDLANELARLIDPITGEPAVETVERTALIAGGSPPHILPDLFVRWKPRPRFVDRVVHPQAHLYQIPGWYHRGSDHSNRGFFAAAGPQVNGRAQIDDISGLDVAPTLLAMMGTPIPTELSGHPVSAVLSNADFTSRNA